MLGSGSVEVLERLSWRVDSFAEQTPVVMCVGFAWDQIAFADSHKARQLQ
jgi:hypothetical protein